MRLRTGHGPNDWSDNEPSHAARHVFGSGGFLHVGGGEFVRGGESEADRLRRQQRETMRRYRAKAVDMTDYQKEHRWEGKERCGVIMRQAGVPCVRMAGHKREHKSAEAAEYQRQSRRRVA